MFGLDWDHLAAYYTIKYVRVWDWRLAFLRLGYIIFILAWTIGWKMLHEGSHLQRIEWTGVSHVQLVQPTLDCNYMDQDCENRIRKKATLPYCEDSEESANDKRPCAYYPAYAAGRAYDGGYFISTRITSFNQTRNEEVELGQDEQFIHGRLLDFVYRNGTVQHGPGAAVPITDYFIADVEDYLIVLDHKIDIRGSTQDYDDSDMAGYWQYKRNFVKRIPCVPGHNGNSLRHCNKEELKEGEEAESSRMYLDNAAENFGGAEVRFDGFSTNVTVEDQDLKLRDKVLVPQEDTGIWDASKRKKDELVPPTVGEHGVVFTLATLLNMSDINLDEIITEDWVMRQDNGKTIRSHGSDILIRIYYTNDARWVGLKMLPWDTKLRKPIYTIFVSRAKAESYSFHEIFDDEGTQSDLENPGRSRTVLEFRGVQITVEQIGSIYTWSSTGAVLLILASAGLISAGIFAIDCFMLSISSEYEDIYYTTSEHIPVQMIPDKEQAQALFHRQQTARRAEDTADGVQERPAEEGQMPSIGQDSGENAHGSAAI